MYRPPPFETADRLCAEIVAFLVHCGGPYKKGQRKVIENVLIAIATGQFFYKRGCYFVCFWKITPDEIDCVKDRMDVSDICHGSAMVVVECGVNGNYMREIVRKLRKRGTGMKQVMWHRPAHGDRFNHFPSQKGGM